MELSPGISCKACDCPLPEDNEDLELCRYCMLVVMDYNKDLYKEELNEGMDDLIYMFENVYSEGVEEYE